MTKTTVYPPEGWHYLTLSEMAAHTDTELHGMRQREEIREAEVVGPDGAGWIREDYSPSVPWTPAMTA